MKKKLGKIHVYTGNGKGKTTACLGSAVRAVGWGLKVGIIFFAKGGFDYGERNSLLKIGIDFWVNGISHFNKNKSKYDFKISKQDKTEAIKGMIILEQIFKENQYDLIILDEINFVLKEKMIDKDYFVNLLKHKPNNMELILTGRGALPAIIKIAHLVTEMKLIKHYYYQGVKARQGIEY